MNATCQFMSATGQRDSARTDVRNDAGVEQQKQAPPRYHPDRNADCRVHGAFDLRSAFDADRPGADPES